VLEGHDNGTLGVHQYILKGMAFMAPLAFVSRSKVLEGHDTWHPWSTSVHLKGMAFMAPLAFVSIKFLI
jgi:hypothetical protein